jgi:hypothetical protein
MEELQDYSGNLRPDVTMEDFSKEALTRMWRVGGKMYIGLEGNWFGLIKERYGEDTALELDAEVWRRQTPLEVRQCRRAMNIQGNDVASLLKHLQIDPGSAGIWPDYEVELKDENRGVLTVKRCLALEHFERHGQTRMIKHTCEVLDGEGFEDTARLFNPDMKVTAVKLPPRNGPDEIACQWEFRLEA